MAAASPPPPTLMWPQRSGHFLLHTPNGLLHILRRGEAEAGVVKQTVSWLGGGSGSFLLMEGSLGGSGLGPRRGTTPPCTPWLSACTLKTQFKLLWRIVHFLSYMEGNQTNNWSISKRDANSALSCSVMSGLMASCLGAGSQKHVHHWLETEKSFLKTLCLSDVH